jgi:hypothetical protein
MIAANACGRTRWTMPLEANIAARTRGARRRSVLTGWTLLRVVVGGFGRVRPMSQRMRRPA